MERPIFSDGDIEITTARITGRGAMTPVAAVASVRFLEHQPERASPAAGGAMLLMLAWLLWTVDAPRTYAVALGLAGAAVVVFAARRRPTYEVAALTAAGAHVLVLTTDHAHATAVAAAAHQAVASR
jgi:hypothetical protein